jgi:hypothetical protein
LEGDLTIADFTKINQSILEHLGEELPDQQVALLVDITRPSRAPRDVAGLRASQHYAMRRDIKFILVAGSDKFMRLMTLLMYNLCRPNLQFFNDTDQAIKFVQWGNILAFKHPQ